MQKIKKLKILILFILIVLPYFSFASSIAFMPASQIVSKGSLLKVDLYLYIQNGDDINAISGHINFPKEFLAVDSVNFGNSIISFWPESPHEISTNDLSFSGIIPGGYKSKEKGLLFSIVFKVLKEGNTSISMSDVLALKNDGMGTKINLSLGSGNIKILGGIAGDSNNNNETFSAESLISTDTEAPETFIPLIGKDPNIFSGKYFIVFSTLDKISGVEHYDIQENVFNFINKNSWIKAESPYLLQDQDLHKYIFVRAVDKAGNTRIEILKPTYPQKLYHYSLFYIIIISVMFSLLVLYKIKKRKSLI